MHFQCIVVQLTTVGNNLFFAAQSSVWSTEGGTGLAIRRVFTSSVRPVELTAFNNSLFFYGGSNSRGLFKTNGTNVGAELVLRKDGVRNLTLVGNTLFFSADDSVNGWELWKSDGTKNSLVKDIKSFNQDSSPSQLTAVGNTLYFTADDGVNGRELWKSDGTTAGTILVKDINPVSINSNPSQLTAVGNTLYFVADDGVNGFELWKSDGTEAGTILVKNIRPGASISNALENPRYLTAVGNTLYFVADDGVNGRELWKSDGTEAGTVLVKNRVDIRADLSIDVSVGYEPKELVAVGNTLFFTADSRSGGRELWKSDGTSGSTTLVQNIRPGGASSNPQNLTVLGNTLFFSADDGSRGNELWGLKLATIAIGSVFGSDAQVEGNTGAAALTFAVTRSGDTTITNTLNWAVTGSGINPADATDFVGGVLPSGTVSFAPGETFKLIAVNVQGDTTPEGDETFTVNLSNATNGAIFTTASAIGTILSDDPFTGTAGNDTLVGTAGPDTLIGLAGNDTYTVNNSGDMVVEQLNQGTDTVNASVSYTLPDNVENLILTGSGNINGTGNALNNILTGNSGANILMGGDGNDTLDGKGGSDTMIGGRGNDTYIVDTIASLFVPGDMVIENANEGTDTVRASVSYTLPDNVENLILTGRTNINGTGNSLNNIITGNTGNNILNGGAGADTLTGGTGADTFVFRFGQSTVNFLGSIVLTDRITDFAIGIDKIDLLTQGGAAMNAPVAFTRAADTLTTNINTIVANVFADANGALAGNQALGINRAALVKANTSTYLIVNDGVAGFQSANDLVINLTGITGTLPALGTIAVNSFFV